MLTRRLIPLLSLLAIGFLSGCAPSKNDQSGDSAAGSSSASSASTPAPANNAADSTVIKQNAADYIEHGTGRSGGTLRISTSLDTGTLDFQSITHTNAKWLGRILFDNLVYLDEKGDITPWLARSWTISPDGKTYTFHLRQDVTFNDGVKFNAEAVKVNLDRMRNPATRAAMTTAYIAPYVDGKVIDEFTFQANLSEPYTPFLNVLAQSWLGMYSPKAILETPKDLATRPVGSGPFVLESYTRQEGIRFKRRDDYNWAPDFIAHKGPAYLERISVDFVPEPMIRYHSLVAAQYDLTIDAPPQMAAAIRADNSLVLHSRINLGNPFRAVTFNVQRAPFDDVRIRKAFALAVDREGIERITGFGEFRLKTDFLSATTRFYDPSFQAVLKFDPTHSNKILDDAGWITRDSAGYRTKNGQRLSAEIMLAEGVLSPPIAVAVQSDLQRIGFELKLVQLPAAQATELRRAGNYQAVISGIWHTNTPDGLYIVYHGSNITTPLMTGQNVSRLKDPRLDDLLTRARQSQNIAEQAALYRDAQKLLTEIVPAVPLYENHTILAHQSYVKGVVFDTSHNTPFATTIWLDRR